MYENVKDKIVLLIFYQKKKKNKSKKIELKITFC